MIILKFERQKSKRIKYSYILNYFIDIPQMEDLFYFPDNTHFLVFVQYNMLYIFFHFIQSMAK